MVRETARIISMILLTIAAGAANGLIVHVVMFGPRLRLSPTMLLSVGVGALLGYFTCAIVVPTLWRRQLTKALPIVYFAGAASAGIAALALPTIVAIAALPTTLAIIGAPTNVANGIGCLSMILTAVAVRSKMPAVFEEVLPGHCPTCGYNLRGARSVRCPECGHRASDPIRTAQSRWDKWSSHIRWWLVPTWIAPSVAYFLCMLIPTSATALREMERWPTNAAVGLVVGSTFLLSSVMVCLTLRGLPLYGRLASTTILGILLLPVNYVALWCFLIAGTLLGFHG